MERIWAPWRMAYIASAAEEEGCFICHAKDAADDRQHLVLARTTHTMTMMNRYPYINGHLMVAPLRHTAEMDELGDDELLDLMHGVRLACRMLQEVSRPAGFNIGVNLGRVAGAGLVDHLHIHVVPRWNGDTNFMPVLADARVINQGLMEVYDQLHAAFTAV